MMLGLQIKAFLLLLVLLLIVDAAAFKGQYRAIVGEKLGSIFSAVTPGSSNTPKGGRDWSSPGRPHR
jgi:hypothetical protein